MPKRRSPIRLAVFMLGVALPTSMLFLFPGQRLLLAFTLATGIGTPSLQLRIKAIEVLAIKKAALSNADREFLRDFYGTLATGAKVTIVLGETGRLMTHYLSGTGTAFSVDPRLFTENAKVQRQVSKLRARARAAPHAKVRKFVTPIFHMPDTSKLDSVFGLYDGTVTMTETVFPQGRNRLHFRAEVPWQWPSYESLKRKYGRYNAESFPLPNLRSLLFGQRYALFVDNGLGEYLAQLGLAKPFLAYAEWDESAPAAASPQR